MTIYSIFTITYNNINTHLSVIVPKSNPPLLAYLIWCSSSPVLLPSPIPILTNLQLHSIYTALGGIAKSGEIPNKVMTLRII